MAQSAKEHKPLETRVLEFTRRNHLLAAGSRVVVAVSGGPDSVCLLHILLSLKDTLGITLYIAHLNHGLRGASSRADAEYVAVLARDLGIPSTIEERDVTAYRARHSMSLEEAARAVRYGFLMEVARSVDAAAVATGHTRDDNVETVLMHLIRGTGTKGLCGLQPRNRWSPSGRRTGSLEVVRPLLDISRQETAGYCREHGLTPRTDETNLTLSLLRNRVRLELLPTLRSYNPRVDDALLRTALIAGDELSFLDKKGARVWASLSEERDGTVILDRPKLRRHPAAIKRHVLRTAMEKALGDLKDVEARHIEGMLAALPKPSGSSISLPGGLVFGVEHDRYLLTRDLTAVCPFPAPEGEFALRVPGETVASGWRVTATVSRGETSVETGIPTLSTLEERTGEISHFSLSRPSFSACFDLDLVGGKLIVRSCRPGDRFQPLGLGKSKKVAQFMVDARIPRWWRDRVPIVASPGQIMWVAGWRIDERVKVTQHTNRVLRLEFSRAQDAAR